MGKINLTTEFCFATGILALAKLTLGNNGGPQGTEEKGQVLTGYNVSSLVIDTLCDQAGGQNATIACFYFDFATQKEQSPTNMLGALLRQLVCGLEETPEEVSRVYQGRENAIGGRGPKLSDIVKMMQTTSSKKRTFICIDALDECVAGHRIKILNSLNQILEKSPDTRIFVTGRPHIRPEIERCLAGRVVDVSISPKRGDIIRYLHSRLHEDTTPDAMDSNLKADILKKIPEEISEMCVEATTLSYFKLSADRYTPRFLLVSLNIDAVLQETTIHRRRQKLDTMIDGVGLGDAYGVTLGRIKRQGGEKARLGMAALMWILHSERPLKTDELCHALSVEIGSPHLNSDNVPSIRTLLSCCQGLVTVDKEASIVRLIHYTLQEYLRAHPGLFSTVHSTMAETCLSYLNSQQIGAFSTSPSPDLRDTPFLEYSSLYWGVHAKKELSDSAKSLALRLFDDYDNHISIKILLERHSPYLHKTDFSKLSLFCGLHYASIFGIVEIVASLIKVEGCDINQIDCTGNTPLVWAALNGRDRVVKILLEQDDVDPDMPGNRGRTPLYCAAKYGHEGVVKILLGRDDVNPDKPDNCHRTPLHCAAEYGYEAVVKIFLGRDNVNPDRPDVYGRTPLYRAAWCGQEGAVKILLGRDDVNPDKPEDRGQTPLHCASKYGREGVVKILLEHNANPDKPDKSGRTPLHYAAEYGHEGVVKILREDDVNPKKAR